MYENKKGDLAAPIIMWIAVFSVALIIIPWFVENVRPQAGEAQQIEFDIRQITSIVDIACNSASYTGAYNPRVNRGVVSFNESTACVQAFDRTNCAQLTCAVYENVSVALEDIIELRFNMSNEELRVGYEEFV